METLINYASIYKTIMSQAQKREGATTIEMVT